MSAASPTATAGTGAMASRHNARSAVAVIATKELRELLRDRRLHALAVLLLLLMLAALALGWQQRERAEAEQAQAQNLTYGQWLAQGNRNPHSAAHFGQYAFRPESALSFLDPGIGAYVGGSVWMEAHKQNEFRFRPARDATALRRFGDLSIAFVWQVLSPLLIVLLAFNAFSGERERGTLRQLLAAGVRPSQLFAGKALALSAVVAAVLLPPLLVALAALLLDGDAHDHAPAAAVPRLLLMGLGTAVYLLGFALLALGVSAAARSSRQALVLLLAFWVLNTFVAPRAMVDVAARVAPTPSAIAFQRQLVEARKATFGHDEKHPAFLAFRERTFAQYQVTRAEDMPANFKALALAHDDAEGYRIFDAHYGRLWQTYAAQERVRAAAGLVFPLVALQPWSMAMAGTDVAQHNAFATAAERYRRGIQDAMSADMVRNRPNTDADYVAGEALWKTIAPFEHDAVPFGRVLAGAVWPFVLLLAWAMFAGAFALRATRRLSPVAAP